MTELTLSSCKNCWMLPSLGQLPSLKTLEISRMDALVTIDASFYRNNNDSSMLTPFPLLESLSFIDMLSWEVWSSIEPYSFPKLKELMIQVCPKLRRDLPSHLPALEMLYIADSSLTYFDLETVPNLDTLSLMYCENLESILGSTDCAMQKLREIEIEDCPNLVSFHGVGPHAQTMIEFKKMNTLPNLKELRIFDCPKMEWFPEEVMFPGLQSIWINNCEKLLSGSTWPSMDMLTDVIIYGPCDGIKSFPKVDLLPSSLTSLRINGFENLETLDCKGLLNLNSLQCLIIEKCPQLGIITGERLPSSVTELEFYKCPLLEEHSSQKIWPKISHIHDIKADWNLIP